MADTPSIALIGPGVMAEAVISGLIRNQVAEPTKITAAGPRQERGDELIARYGICFTLDNPAAVKEAEIVVLSVKPQRLHGVLAGLRGKIAPETLVFSIVAGASMLTISQALDHPKVVRVMPNTPAQIGKGIAVWTASSSVNQAQKDLSRRILNALGQEIFVEDETMLDMATALSGTGPAYVFLFMEALIDSGVHLGFPRRISEALVLQTLRGSVEYYAQKKDHPAHLRNEVTSPGGTSAEALYYLEKAGFRTAISRAIWAAYERSQELGRGKNSASPEKQGS